MTIEKNENDSVSKRIEQGVEKLMEFKHALAFANMNLDTMDMGQYDHCLLTGLFGDYAAGLEMLKIPIKDDYKYGFCVAPEHGDYNNPQRVAEYELLNKGWRVAQGKVREELTAAVSPGT
jgi:hypothetical protein